MIEVNHQIPVLKVDSYPPLLISFNTALASDEVGPVGDGKPCKGDGEAGGDLPLSGES